MGQDYNEVQTSLLPEKNGLDTRSNMTSWCLRHSQNHIIAFKFVKICLNANFKFHCSIHLLMFFWYKSFSSPRLPSGCACHLAVLATDLEVYSSRQRLIWIEGPVGVKLISATETRPFFNASWFFSSKLVTRIFVKDPDLGSALEVSYHESMEKRHAHIFMHCIYMD